jgi:hypothetical protein
VRLEPEPKVGLRAHRFVVVARIVEDNDAATWTRKAGEHLHDTRRPRRMMKQAHGKDRIGTAKSRLAHTRAIEVAVHEFHVAVAARFDARPRQAELGLRAVDRNDVLEQRREEIEQSPVPRSRVDRELSMGDERRQRRQVRQEIARRHRVATILALAARLSEEVPRNGIARRDHVRDAGERSILFAKYAPTAERVDDHGIAPGFFGQPYEGTRPLLAHCQQAGLLERRRVTRNIWLTLPHNLRKLADRELFLLGERKKPKPHGFREDAIKLPARSVRTSEQLVVRDPLHRFYIYTHTNKCK